MKTQMVEILITVAQDAESKLYDGEPKFSGEYIFRALDANGMATAPFTYELHYSKDWTGVTGNGDPINQLKYPNPPESSTVITWCTYHAAVNHSDQIPVLMLDGRAKSAHSDQFTNKGPLAFVPSPGS